MFFGVLRRYEGAGEDVGERTGAMYQMGVLKKRGPY
jgi:hypothetical protein